MGRVFDLDYGEFQDDNAISRLQGRAAALDIGDSTLESFVGTCAAAVLSRTARGKECINTVIADAARRLRWRYHARGNLVSSDRVVVAETKEGLEACVVRGGDG
jgi:hypothetical protein